MWLIPYAHFELYTNKNKNKNGVKVKPSCTLRGGVQKSREDD
jgi:hypothetical protein